MDGDISDEALAEAEAVAVVRAVCCILLVEAGVVVHAVCCVLLVEAAAVVSSRGYGSG